MVVVLSLSANVQFCLSKMFRTPVTPHETNLLLSEITVRPVGRTSLQNTTLGSITVVGSIVMNVGRV